MEDPYKYDWEKYMDNKVCPIMSPERLRFDGCVIHCVGKDCMWYGECIDKEYVVLTAEL